jgi:hypothetical protein
MTKSCPTFGEQFPALVYILEYKKAAVPVLLNTIAGESSLSLKAKNAVEAIIMIEAQDPPTGVRRIVEAASRTDSSSSARVLEEAAHYATNTWACHLLLTECAEYRAPRLDVAHDEVRDDLPEPQGAVVPSER